ncbi:MAG TPA: GntR family transcriptional regulator [Solirubrobacteraceae bacterium]|jgi:DNA-binding GntR family transcriptional regulator|nr:GntR family transcriptional regulator [Solirubrobacteraceae bacterium]
MNESQQSDRSGRRQRSDTVYAELRRALMLGEYPLIERLGEVKLAEQFGASRTPIREALMRLESEGLVHRRPEGGFYPSSPNLADIRDLYELRRIIEVGTITRAGELGITPDRDAIGVLRNEWEAMLTTTPEPEPDFVLLDEDFHLRLAATSGNETVARHLHLVNERIRVVRMQDFLDTERIEITIRQHLTILEALLGDETQHAIALLAAHLDEARQQATIRATAAVERMMTVGAAFNR